MSTTFSVVVYVKPPHARPNRPSTIRITPNVLFTASSFGDAKLAGTEQSGKSSDGPLLHKRVGCYYLVLSSILSAPCSTFLAVLCTAFLLTFFVALPVFFTASPVDFPACLTSCPASLISSFAVCAWSADTGAQNANAKIIAAIVVFMQEFSARHLPPRRMPRLLVSGKEQ